MPMPSAKPDRDIMFREIPEKYISISAVSTDRGMLTATTSVGFTSFKNNANTIIARMAPTIILCSTPFIIMVI